MPEGGIIEKGGLFAETLHHQKVIEIPKYDDREGHLFQARDFFTVPFGIQTIPPRRFDDARSFTAIARNSAFATYFRERTPQAKIAQNHPQRGRAAFDGLDLQENRRVFPDRFCQGIGTPLLNSQAGSLCHVTHRPRRPSLP